MGPRRRAHDPRHPHDKRVAHLEMTSAESVERVPTQCHPWYGLLVVMAPAAARRFAVEDPELASTLRAAGATLEHELPDVEIRTDSRVVGNAPSVLVALSRPRAAGRWRAVRLVSRASRSLGLEAQCRATRRRLSRLGFGQVRTVRWERSKESPLPLPGGDGAPGARSVAPLLRLNALIWGSRSDMESTALEVALNQARAAVGSDLRPGVGVLGAGGVVLVIGDRHVVRVAGGGAVGHLRHQEAALESLRRSDLTEDMELTPRILARGEAGLCRWTVERRLPGAPPHELSDRVFEECVDFLVALHAAGSSRGSAQSGPAADAATISRACPDALGSALRELGTETGRRLDGVPRGFAHGDFWAGNLLVRNGGLTGVVDWAGGGDGRLPCLDLMHLWLNGSAGVRPEDLTRAVIHRLLPWAREGSDPRLRSYCAGLGLTTDGAVLEALALAYWFERMALEAVAPGYDRSEGGDDLIRAGSAVLLREVGRGQTGFVTS